MKTNNAKPAASAAALLDAIQPAARRRGADLTPVTVRPVLASTVRPAAASVAPRHVLPAASESRASCSIHVEILDRATRATARPIGADAYASPLPRPSGVRFARDVARGIADVAFVSEPPALPVSVPTLVPASKVSLDDTWIPVVVREASANTSPMTADEREITARIDGVATVGWIAFQLGRPVEVVAEICTRLVLRGDVADARSAEAALIDLPEDVESSRRAISPPPQAYPIVDTSRKLA